MGWEPEWQEVADLVLPYRDFSLSDPTGPRRIRRSIYDGTAPDANESLAAAVHGLLTNPAIRWFALTPADESVEPDELSQVWLYDSTSKMLNFCASTESGFAVQSHETYLDLCSFGTSNVTIRRGVGSLRLQTEPMAACFAAEDDDGRLVEHHFRFSLTLREAVVKFGDQLAPETQKEAEDNSKANKRIEFIHSIIKRRERDPMKLDRLNKPWGSYYVELARKHLVSEGGFDRMPRLMPRWSKGARDPYGYGPGLRKLPDIRTANAMTLTILMAGELAVRPPLNVPSGMLQHPPRIAPGAVNYYQAGSKDRIEPVFDGANPLVGMKLLEDRIARIERGFFNDKFSLPENDRMTATEIVARRQQGLLAASPVLSRMYAEYLIPVLTEVYHFLKESNRLMPTPPQLQGAQLTVDFLSPLALSQRASESQGFQAAMADAQQIVAHDPSVVANLNSDYAYRRAFQWHNVDPRMLKSRRQVEAARAQQREETEAANSVVQAQQIASAGRDAAAAAKDLSNVA